MKQLHDYQVTIRTGGHSQRHVLIRSCVSPTAAARVAHLTKTKPGETAILAWHRKQSLTNSQNNEKLSHDYSFDNGNNVTGRSKYIRPKLC